MNKVVLGLKGFGKKISLKAAHRAPEILLISGIGCMVGSTIFACKGTLKAKEVLAMHKDRIGTIEEVRKLMHDESIDPNTLVDNDGNVITEQDLKMDTVQSYVMMSKDYIRIYWPAVALGVVGVILLTKSYGVLKTRNIALISAYNILAKAFKEYRGRVVEELGEEMDHHYRYGTMMVSDKIVGTDENGKKITTKETGHIYDDKILTGDAYSRVFDCNCSNWCNNDEYNLMFVKAQEDLFNLDLRKHGVVFLNDVYTALGFEKTQAGQVVGWSTNGTGDGVIEFNVKKVKTVNNIANGLLIDFNVDGPVYNEIKQKV